jgi:hypothetical protein
MKQNSILFNEVDICDKVYFILNGEFELFVEKNIQEVNQIILQLKEIVDYLRNHSFDFLNIGQDADAYLEQMDTIATDHRFDIVCIGSILTNDIDNQLRLCASHYRYAFTNHVKSFPYFE